MCDPRGSPDVLVLYDLAFLAGSIRGRIFDSHSHLARLSGCDGGVIWDVLLAEHKGGLTKLMGFVHEVADLDGDGNLEIVLLLKSKAATGSTPRELRVLSLANGEMRWRHQLNQDAAGSAGLAVGDLDGDGRPEVIMREQPRQGIKPAIEVTALDGQAGKLLWTWSGGEAHDESDKNPPPCLARFDDSGRLDVCVNFSIAQGRRVVILDAEGHERNGRDLESGSVHTLLNADLDGDGRDELLFHDGGRLAPAPGDLKEQWSWPTRESIRDVIPASTGRPATVVLNPSLGLDGATGRPIWSGGPARSILRASDDKSLPRLLTGPEGTTVCRTAVVTTAEGLALAAPGMPAKPAALRDDPRRERPLPWVGPVEPFANPLVQVAMAATLINVCLPLAILWLATRRRF